MDEHTCPSCGFITSRLHDGYCLECCEDRQAELDQHNWEFDNWESMSDAERGDAIRRAM